MEAYKLIRKMKDYTNEIGFWKRLESFIKEVQVNDPCSEEDQEMIMHCCKLKIFDLQNISNHVKIATLKYENHGFDCVSFGKEYKIERKDNYSGGRIHIISDNGKRMIYPLRFFNCC